MKIFVDDIPQKGLTINEIFDLNPNELVEEGSFVNPVSCHIQIYREGDKVVVDRAQHPKHGDIVVAVVDGEYTIKRLFKHMGRVELRPENSDYPSIVFHDGSELMVWGVVVGVVRRYASKR